MRDHPTDELKERLMEHGAGQKSRLKSVVDAFEATRMALELLERHDGGGGQRQQRGEDGKEEDGELRRRAKGIKQ